MITLTIKPGEKYSSSVNLTRKIIFGLYFPSNLTGNQLKLLASPDGEEYHYVSLDHREIFTVRNHGGSHQWLEIFPSVLRSQLEGISFIKFRASKIQHERVEIKIVTTSYGAVS